MRNKDPYIEDRSTQRVTQVTTCRGCTQPYRERAGDGSDGYCALCCEGDIQTLPW